MIISKSPVTPSKNPEGNFINTTSNPDVCYMILRQEVIEVKNNFPQPKLRSCIFFGTQETLSMFIENPEMFKGAKIIRKDSFKPFDTKNPERTLKVAGNTGIVCTKEGMNIYTTTEVSWEENAKDVIIEHDNIEEIKAANRSNLSNTVNQSRLSRSTSNVLAEYEDVDDLEAFIED